jgi:hypothetical protein
VLEKKRVILIQLNNYYLLKKDSSPWSLLNYILGQDWKIHNLENILLLLFENSHYAPPFYMRYIEA